MYQGNAREDEVEAKSPGAQRVRAAEAAGTHAQRPTCLDYRPPNVLAHRGELSAKEARPGGAMGLP